MMKREKTMGLDGIPIKVWNYLGDVGVYWLTKFFKKILSFNKMPMSGGEILQYLFIGIRVDTQNYTSYHC